MDPRDILQGLTPEQRAAAEHKDGPLLIVAGAGSGKTRTVTRRIAHLIATGVEPSAILAITFTNKAAGEMRERVAALVPGGLRDDGPTVATFHAFALSLLRRYKKRLGFPRGFSVLGPSEQLTLIREAAVEARVDFSKCPAPRIAERIGRVKERLDDEGFIAGAISELDRATAAVLPIYRELQARRGALDFDDLVAGAVRLLEDHDDVREAFLDEVHYVLIDEYQDTNHAQYRLANLLAGERRNLAVCGDPDQSIYAWRGADMRNILRFEEDYPEAKVVLLEQNYRSTANILSLANALIRHNTERKDKQLLPTGEEGRLIDVLQCSDAEMEADAVARRVKKCLDDGITPSEVAVAFRGKAHAGTYEEALARRGIRCTVVGATSFFDRREVKDALAWVRLAVNIRDDLAALRALRHTVKGIGKKTIEKLYAQQRRSGKGLVEVCEAANKIEGLTPGRRGELLGFARRVRELEGDGKTSVQRLVQGAIISAGLAGGGEQDDPRAEVKKGSLDKLESAAQAADKKGGGPEGPQRFLDRLSLLDAQDRDDPRDDRVVLTTIHASKGLEFDVVFVVGLEEGLFPHYRSVEEGMLEEERRLAYVAFTRARQHLILTYAVQRRSRGPAGRGPRRPSTFLYELPKSLLWDPTLREPMVLPDPAAKEEKPPAPPPAKRRPPPKGKKLLGVSGGKGGGSKLWSQGLTRSNARA